MQIPNMYVITFGGHVPRSVSLLLAAVLLLTGCSGPGGTEARDEGAAADSGPMTFVVGKDTTSYFQPLLDRWNRAHPDERVTMLELPEAAHQRFWDYLVSSAHSLVNTFEEGGEPPRRTT